MKNIICIIILVISISIIYSQQVDNFVYCQPSINDLRLRQDDSINSAVKRIITKKDILKLHTIGHKISINGINGYWIKVETSDHEIGYCFDGYINYNYKYSGIYIKDLFFKDDKVLGIIKSNGDYKIIGSYYNYIISPDRTKIAVLINDYNKYSNLIIDNKKVEKGIYLYYYDILADKTIILYYINTDYDFYPISINCFSPDSNILMDSGGTYVDKVRHLYNLKNGQEINIHTMTDEYCWISDKEIIFTEVMDIPSNEKDKICFDFVLNVSILNLNTKEIKRLTKSKSSCDLYSFNKLIDNDTYEIKHEVLSSKEIKKIIIDRNGIIK